MSFTDRNTGSSFIPVNLYAIFIFSNLVIIGHFRVALSLCVKTSLHAKLLS